ncbi:hypothetical protein ACFLVP_03175 [Chloroflexota bacterium]
MKSDKLVTEMFILVSWEVDKYFTFVMKLDYFPVLKEYGSTYTIVLNRDLCCLLVKNIRDL